MGKYIYPYEENELRVAEPHICKFIDDLYKKYDKYTCAFNIPDKKIIYCDKKEIIEITEYLYIKYGDAGNRLTIDELDLISMKDSNRIIHDPRNKVFYNKLHRIIRNIEKYFEKI